MSFAAMGCGSCRVGAVSHVAVSGTWQQYQTRMIYYEGLIQNGLIKNGYGRASLRDMRRAHTRKHAHDLGFRV